MKPACSLWICVARTDVAFMMHTIPHLVKMCRYPFTEKVLLVETAPLSGEKSARPNLGTMEDLIGKCRELQKMGIIDRWVEADYSKKLRRALYQKHFNFPGLKATHNWKGYPVYGSILSIEKSAADYFLHFDSDMLLHQSEKSDWISDGIKLLQKNKDILWVRAQAGPGQFANPQYKNEADKRDSFFKLKGFASRVYLIDKIRFESVLPMRSIWAKKQGRIKDILPRYLVDAWHNFSGNGLLESWEIMVSEAMKDRGMYRADVADKDVWTIHPSKHGAEFIEKLPKIIEQVEKGSFPPAQAGKYDLDLNVW